MILQIILPSIYKAVTFILKYVENEENICDYSGFHPYKYLLKVKELIHYVNFVADVTTPNVLTIDIVKKATKNDKLLH